MERGEIVEKFAEFFKEYFYNELVATTIEGKKSLLVDFSVLDKFDPELADYLLENPDEVLTAIEDSLKQIDLPSSTNIRIRFFNLPEERQIRIRNIRAEHIGKLISVDGIVKRASEIRPEVSEAIFQCLECGAKINVIQTERFIIPPNDCQCGNRRNFKLIDQKLYDARWITIEEPFEITSGERPSEIMIFLKEDLTSPKMQNKTDPGNRIKVVGVLKQIPRRVKGTRSRQLEIYIDANSVESVEVEWEELEITPEDEKMIVEFSKDPEIYSKLVTSIAPSLYGLEHIKEAIVLQLFGGEQHVQKDKSRVRGDIHILLVGDPSTAKSALMKVVSTLIPRGKYVSGKGVTAAGLCTVYETLVQLEDGSLIQIGKLVEEELKKDFEKIEDGFVTQGSPRKILSFDQENLKLKPLRITRYWKLKAPKKMVKVVTQTGKEVIVTPENPIPVIKNAKICWKPASELIQGEYIATPRICSVNENKSNQTKSLGELPKNIVLSKCHGYKINTLFSINSDLTHPIGSVVNDRSIPRNNREGFDIKFLKICDDFLMGFRTVCWKELCIEPYHSRVPYFIFNPMTFSKYGAVKEYETDESKFAEELSLLPKNILATYLQVIFDTSGSVIEKNSKRSNRVELSSNSKEFIRVLQLLLLRYGIISLVREKSPRTSLRGRTVNSGKKYVLVINGLKNLKIFRKKIGFRDKYKSKKLDEIIEKCSKENSNIDVIPEIGNLLREIRNELGLSAKEFYGYKSYEYEKNIRKPTRSFLKKLLNKFGQIKDLVKFVESDIFWDRIEKVEIIENKDYEYVYDITVEDEHSFVANGIIIHNTATVVRDEEFLGGWVLEAGALVMCNKSLCAIDEFEKVEKSDQVALHEAMEQQTISIAKASIVATLPAQTSILAGGNPKLGRFDPYLPIKEQIDVPETLLSRFDLKFALRDIPNPEIDAKVAEHILKSRHYGEEDVGPLIDSEFLKKYIAYARKNCHPKLSREAGEEIKNFFVSLREKVSAEEAAVPITLRQYEALIRLAEASAKVQLRDVVTREDAIRAINLMKASLREFGFEAETGKFDVDRLEGRTTASERGKIRVVLDIIEELSKTMGNTIPKEDILRIAKDKGLKEFDVEKILNELKNKGDLFEPKVGILQKM
ncbi:MAG: LAGLIDADG family homing endonuclease [Candidatus Aenigmatarchaeota archaeon]